MSADEKPEKQGRRFSPEQAAAAAMVAQAREQGLALTGPGPATRWCPVVPIPHVVSDVAHGLRRLTG